MDKMKRLLVMLAMSICGLIPVYAQQNLKFSIASFEQDPFDMSAKNKQYEKVDGSGSRYAIIKITSNNPDDDLSAYRFNFGNLRSSTEIHDGVLWVYVQKNAKLLTISRDGYQTINKYDLHTTIEAGKNYVMTLATSGPVLYTQMVHFKVKPLGAKAFVMIKSSKNDAQEEMFGEVDQTGSIAKSLEYGVYTYKVVADKYYTAEGRITLRDKSTTHIEEVVLRPNYSDITLSVSSDADIYVNGEKKGTRSWTGVLKAGNYQVECRQANHKNSSQFITVGENDNRTITLTPPTPILGTIAVTSNPLGANINIDGKDYGQTPRNIDVVVGNHQVVLTHADYKQEQQAVDVVENQTTNVGIALSRISKMTIDSNPSGASLNIDGNYVGQTPCEVEMGSGDYLVKLTKNKYSTFQKRIHLDSSNPIVMLPLYRQYYKATTAYGELNYSLGSAPGFGFSIGLYWGGFNIEYGFIYYYSVEGASVRSDYLIADKSQSFKFGYGFLMTNRIRFTPQIGIGVIWAKDGSASSEDLFVSLGTRMEYAISSHIGLFVAPEFRFAVSTDDTGKKYLKDDLSKTQKGFSMNLGLYFTI